MYGGVEGDACEHVCVCVSSVEGTSTSYDKANVFPGEYLRQQIRHPVETSMNTPFPFLHTSRSVQGTAAARASACMWRRPTTLRGMRSSSSPRSSRESTPGTRCSSWGEAREGRVIIEIFERTYSLYLHFFIQSSFLDTFSCECHTCHTPPSPLDTLPILQSLIPHASYIPHTHTPLLSIVTRWEE